jgi:hypothetical protein
MLIKKKQRKIDKVNQASQLSIYSKKCFYFNVKPEEPPKNSKASRVLYLG